MSRPRKQTVDWFSHDCTHKKTMFIVEGKYGNDGYAFWFKLLEMLGGSEGHFLNLNEPEEWEFLQSKTRLSEDLCNEILDLLAKLKAIDPELWEAKIIWSDNFLDRISLVYKNRRVDIPVKPNNYKQKSHSNGITTGRNPQREKESKVKESKVNIPSDSPESSEKENYDIQFEEFWKDYPRKIEKKTAFKQWKIRIKEGHTHTELITSSKNYKEVCRIQGTQENYIKHPATFLGPNKPFLDYLTMPKVTPPVRAKHPSQIGFAEPSEFKGGGKGGILTPAEVQKRLRGEAL